MKGFDEFKASREKTDPTASKMTDHQWEQAYKAYLRSRERVRGRSKTSGSSGSGGRKPPPGGAEGFHGPAQAGPAAGLLGVIRAQTAYGQLRTLIEVLFWVAIGGSVVATAFQLMLYQSVEGGAIAVFNAVVQLAAIVILRFFLQAMVDLPDISLYRHRHAAEPVQKDPGRPDASPES